MTYISEHEPVLETAHTTIWQVGARGHDVTVGYWLIYAPWAHAAWQYHAMSLVHLRGQVNGKDAVIFEPGATHELMIYALAPDIEPDPYNAKILTPVSVAQQFVAEHDAEALGLLEKCLDRIGDATLSPDSDYRKVWRHILVEGCTEI